MEEQLNQALPTEAEVGACDDAAMDEHRAALAKMRTAYALEQLYAASGAKDPSVLGRLIDVDEGDVNIGADGVPDVSAVRAKIDALRRDKGYLFADSAAAEARSAASVGTSAMRLGVIAQADVSQMDDASYYRAVLGRKRGGRR